MQMSKLGKSGPEDLDAMVKSVPMAATAAPKKSLMPCSGFAVTPQAM